MDLSKQRNDTKLQLCRKYFYYGFAFLPFMWAINAVWFYREAFSRPPYPEQKDIKKFTTLSAIGALVWALGLGAWIIVYQINRATWGEFGDNISFVIPQGRA